MTLHVYKCPDNLKQFVDLNKVYELAQGNITKGSLDPLKEYLASCGCVNFNYWVGEHGWSDEVAYRLTFSHTDVCNSDGKIQHLGVRTAFCGLTGVRKLDISNPDGYDLIIQSGAGGYYRQALGNWSINNTAWE